MATTFVEYTGDGSASKPFSFPSYQESDIKVRVDNVLKISGSHYNITGYTTTGGGSVVFTSGNAPSSPAKIRIYRDTNVEAAKATYTPGSSVKAADLNNNQTQLLYRAQEEQVPNLIQTYDINDDAITSSKIDDGTIVESNIANSAVTQNKLANNSVGTPELINGSVNSDKILDGTIVNADVNASAAIAGTKINADFGSQDVITTGNLGIGGAAAITGNISVSGTVDGRDVAADGTKLDTIETNAKDDQTAAEIKTLLQSDKLTASEIAEGALDGRYFTESESDARYFNISSGETIKDGDTFPDNDTTIATTAAINDRIIDLIDDVGGFDIIQSEQHFPNTNPQGTTGQAAVLSVKAASTNLVPSGTTVTISNGNLANNANIIITGVTSTIPTGFGFLVESTSTTHTYAFHRLVPKATEVTTIASNISNINAAANNESNINAAVSNASNINAAVSNASNINAAVSNASNINSAVSNASNINAAVSNASNITTTASNITNVNNVGNNITNVNSVSNSAGANQTFTVTAVIQSGSVRFHIDGVRLAVLKLARGKTYIFDQSDSSNSGHPLRFRDSSNNAYTSGVTASGTAGSSGATVTFVVPSNAPSTLKYYCTSHGNVMGNTINVIDDNVGTVAGSISNVNTVGGAISNVNTTAGSISNVNTVASNINSVNSFFNTYRIGSNNPTTSLDVGDLFFNTTSNSLKVYTGSAWVDGVTATGNFAVVTGNTFTGSNNHNDNVKSIYGTGSDLEIFNDGTNSLIKNNTGGGHILIQGNGDSGKVVALQPKANENGLVTKADAETQLLYDNSIKLETTSTGASVTGNITTSGQITLGPSQDLEIFHSVPSTDLIRANNGDNIRIRCGNDNMVSINDSQEVALGYDGSTKLQTTSGGVNILGALTVNGSAINTDLVSDTTPQLGGTLDTNNNNIHFNDNVSARFGTSQDLDIFHDGNRSAINNNTGELRILSSDDVIIGKRSGGDSSYSEQLAAFKVDGEVELYYDNARKLKTNSTGFQVGTTSARLLIENLTSGDGSEDIARVGLNRDNGSTSDRQMWLQYTVSGSASQAAFQARSANDTGTAGTYLKIDAVNNTIDIPRDDSRLRLGASSDFQIYHDGSRNRIDAFNGHSVIIRNTYGVTEQMGVFTPNGPCELMYDGSKKFETYSGGVRIHGELLMQSNHFYINDNAKLRIGTGQDLELYHNGSDSYIDSKTNNLAIRTTNAGHISIKTNDEYGIFCQANGSVDLYYDNSKKFETNSGGAEIFGHLKLDDSRYLKLGNSGGTADVQIFHNGHNFHIQHLTSGALYMDSVGNHHFRNSNGTEYRAEFKNNGAVELYYDNVKKFETASFGVDIIGTLGADMVKVGDNDKFVAGASDDLQIYHDSYTGYNHINFVNGPLVFTDNTTHRAYFNDAGHFFPWANSTYDLGSTSNRWRNIYTGDLHLSNKDSSNDIDGTWGDWTMQEGESDLFLKNNRSGKKYKFNLTEVS